MRKHIKPCYWALGLAAFAVTGCGFVITVRTPTRPNDVNVTSDPDDVETPPQQDEARACVWLGSARTTTHTELFDLLNDYRAANGQSRLRYSRTLEQAADAYAVRLFREDFFDHVAPDGSEPADRALAAGFCDRFVGENLAYGQNQVMTPAEALAGFINSPAHNENMLRPQWDYAAIGYLQVSGFQGVETWWVQMFGTESAP